MEELVKYKILKVDEATGEEFTGLDEVAFTSDPAIISKGFAFSAQKRLSFSDKPKMRIVAPAMIPMDIYRNQDGEEFEVTFTVEQIEEIHKDLMLKMRSENLFNFEHDKSRKVPAYILEAWIVDNPKEDKAWSSYGIDVPKGTLMLTTQITDEAFYNKLVEKDQLGYSIGGSFGLKLSKQTKPDNMKLPDGTHVIQSQRFTIQHGEVIKVEDVQLSETDKPEDEETKEVETEMGYDETDKEKETEMMDDKVEMMDEVTETVTEENPMDAPLTKEEVTAMIDEKVGEVLNMLAEMKAMIEEAKVNEMEEEEAAPVQLSVNERLAKFSTAFKNK